MVAEGDGLVEVAAVDALEGARGWGDCGVVVEGVAEGGALGEGEGKGEKGEEGEEEWEGHVMGWFQEQWLGKQGVVTR